MMNQYFDQGQLDQIVSFLSSNWKALLFTWFSISASYKILKLINKLKKYDEILKGLPVNRLFPITKGFGVFKFAKLNYKNAVGHDKIRYNMYTGMANGSFTRNEKTGEAEKLPGAPLSGMSLLKIAPHAPPMLAITSAEASQVIFKHNVINHASPSTDITKYVFGSTVFTTNGKTWKNKRTRLNKCFGMKLLEGYLDPINNQAKLMINHLNKRYKNSEKFEIQFRGSAFAFSADVAGDVLFGQDFEAQTLYYNENRHPDWQNAVEFVMNDVFAFMVVNPLVWNTSRFKYIYPRLWWKFRKNTAFIRNFLRQATLKRKNILKELGEENKEKNKRVIDTMLDSFEKGEISETEMVSELYTVIVGGYDTSSNTFSDGLAYLATHPEIQEKLYQEIIEYFPDDSSKTFVDFSHLNKMDYLANVVKEMVRLCGPVPGSIRKMEKPIKFSEDYTLYASEKYPVTAFMPIFMINQDEKSWGKDADKFSPERHDNPTDKYAMAGFAHGSRDCVGKNLAVPTMKTQLIFLLKNFKVSLKAGEKNVYSREKTSNIMIRFEEEPVLVFEKRNNA